MDITTIAGIFAGVALVISSILMGPDPGGFIDIPSIMIVVGGTISSVLVACPLEEVFSAFKAGAKVFTTKKTQPTEVVATMVRIAEISRREGILALERIQTDNALLKKATQLIADSADPELIRDTVAIEITSLRRRHNINIDVFKQLAATAPAFGMIGTLIGLVQMLSNLSDASKLGPAMAVALITTFYGSVLANMFFIPLSNKLKARSMQEELTLYIIFEGAKSMLENNNPKLVYEKLSSFLAPSDRNKEEKKAEK